MNKKIIYLLFIGTFLFVMVSFFLSSRDINSQINPAKSNEQINIAQERPVPFFDKEVVDFTVKLRGVKIGSAKLTFNGKINLDGKDLDQVVFDVKTLNIKDIENIYAEVGSYLPFKIERKLNIWGKNYDLLEEYDQEHNSVSVYRLIKTKDKKILEHEIKKDSDIHNVLLVVYSYRLLQDFKIGEVMHLNFPTDDVEVKVTKIEKIRVPAGTYEAYVIETIPKKFKVWIGTDPRRLPLRIDGGVGLGSASMLMVSISEDKK